MLKSEDIIEHDMLSTDDEKNSKKKDDYIIEKLFEFCKECTTSN